MLACSTRSAMPSTTPITTSPGPINPSAMQRYTTDYAPLPSRNTPVIIPNSHTTPHHTTPHIPPPPSAIRPPPSQHSTAQHHPQLGRASRSLPMPCFSHEVIRPPRSKKKSVALVTPPLQPVALSPSRSLALSLSLSRPMRRRRRFSQGNGRKAKKGARIAPRGGPAP